MARVCKGTTAAGNPCRRHPSTDSEYCQAHDPAERDAFIASSTAGGHARHDPAVSSIKTEVRELMAAMRSGEVPAGVGAVMLQAYRLLREIDAEDRQHAEDYGADGFVESIRVLRTDDSIPDLSEPAGNGDMGEGGITGNSPEYVEDDPDAPRIEDYPGRADEYIRDSAAYHAPPLTDLTPAQRRGRMRGIGGHMAGPSAHAGTTIRRVQ
jgi:hypothetical protein